MLVIIYSKLLILDVRQKDTKSYRPPPIGAHDVILTGLDEEGDSTNKEMPPLEPLEGAAQLGEVWLCGHERRM